jgi:hypothetical protein
MERITITIMITITITIKKFIGVMFVAVAAGLCGGCSKTETGAPAAQAAPANHEHHPPHGGAAVDLGREEYHLEFVLDAAGGRLQAFVLDGEMENFIRIAASSLEITAKAGGREEKLLLLPVASRATGETAGDTSMFEAQADWLKTTPVFDAVLKQITVRSTTYTNVAFNYPKGSDS